MKKISFVILLTVFTFLSNAQSTVNYNLKVIDLNSNPMEGVLITLTETISKQKINGNTNTKGIASFEITYGKEWEVNVGGMKKCDIVEVPTNGTSIQSRTISYNLKHHNRINRPLVDRSKLKIQYIDQTNLTKSTYKKDEAVFELYLKKENNTPLKNYPVNLTCLKTEKTYLNKTDINGVAFFIIPNNSEFEIDIDGIESINYIDIKKSGIYTLETKHEPTDVIENEVNDTIVQKFETQKTGTSSRVLLKLKINKSSANKISDEDVYLQMLKSNKVYKGKTNSNGEVCFLLPPKRKYMVHFKYQKDVDVINLNDMQGIGNSEANFTYNPNPRLKYPEQFIPTPNDLITTNFLDFLEKQYPDPTDDAVVKMDVKWGNDEVSQKSKEAILQLGFKVKYSQNRSNAASLNISLVLDISGSMEGHDRIDALKIALIHYIKQLRPTDIVSLIVFNEKSSILIPAQKVDDAKYFVTVINSIEAGGGTVIYDALIDGYEQVLKNFKPNYTNRVVLLTDGFDSTPVEKLVNKSKEYNKKGIELSTIGVGENYNQSLLSLLSNVGGGMLNFTYESKNLNEIFEKELNSVLLNCAKNLTVDIKYNNQIIFKQLYGHPFTKTNDLVTMSINHVYSGLNTLALLKFDLNNPTEKIEREPIIIKMTYYDNHLKSNVYTEEKAYLKWRPATNNFEIIMEAEHKKLYAIAILNQSLKVMSEAFVKNNYTLALTEIQNTINQIKNLYPDAKDDDVEKLASSAADYALSLNRLIKKTIKKVKS